MIFFLAKELHGRKCSPSQGRLNKFKSGHGWTVILGSSTPFEVWSELESY